MIFSERVKSPLQRASVRYCKIHSFPFLSQCFVMIFRVAEYYMIAYSISNLCLQVKERNADYNRIVSTITSKAQPRWLNKLAVQQNAKSSDQQGRSKSSSAADRAVQMSYSLKKRYQPWIDQVSISTPIRTLQM